MATTTQQDSWWQAMWPRLAAASGVGYVAVAYAVSRWLTRRSPDVLYLPQHLAACTIEALECRTCDGVLLKGWCIEPVQPRATIALFHGLRGNRLGVLDRVEFLIAAGYRCIAFDHRAHGESGGRLTSFGYHEQHDVKAVARLLSARWPSEPRAALGCSMGAAALCFAGEGSHAFDALILESVYHDLARAFQHRVGVAYPAWLPRFRRGILWFTEHRLRVRVHQIAPVAHIANLIPRPVLLLTGSDDPHAPPYEVQALADRIPETGQFHVIPGAEHENLCAHGSLAYQDLLLAFLERHLFQNRLARNGLSASFESGSRESVRA